MPCTVGWPETTHSVAQTASGMLQLGALLRHESSEEPSEELGERPHRHEVGLAGRLPLRPVTGDPTGRDQAVDVRRVDQRPGPGVQDAEDTKQPPPSCGSAASVMSAGAAARSTMS